MSSRQELMRKLMAQGKGNNSSNSSNSNNINSSSSSNKESAQLYRLLENSHDMTFTGGWIIFALMMLALLLGIGLMGGIWDSIRDDLKTDDFKNYCYGVWASLGFAGFMAIGFIIYFKYHMDDVHEKGLMNINSVYGTNYKHKK